MRFILGVALVGWVVTGGASGPVAQVSYLDPNVGGGNRGYSASFHTVDQYLGSNAFFTASKAWPTTALTVSAWFRLSSFNVTVGYSTALTMIVALDTNHVQPYTFQVLNNAPGIGTFFGLSGVNWVFSDASMSTSPLTSPYWTKITSVYTSNGAASCISLYTNGTKLFSVHGNGTTIYLADGSGASVVGGFPNAANQFKASNKYYGWVDDLAMYNVAWTDSQVAANWAHLANVTDPALFLYYTFDEGPGAKVVKNWGSVGAQGDLTNGAMMGSTTYLETDSQTQRTMQPATFSPGAPAVGATAQPVVYAVDAGVTARLRVTCVQRTAATVATPTQATLLAYGGSGRVYQADAGGARIVTFPAVLSSKTADFMYTAPAINTTESLSFTAVCAGAAQSGKISIIVKPPLIPDPTLSVFVVLGQPPPAVYLHGSIANPTATLKVNITKLPTLGHLAQLNYSDPTAMVPITEPNTAVSNILGVRWIMLPAHTLTFH
jgi:hypothetical protein